MAFGEAGLPAIHEFLTHTGLPRDVQTDVAKGTQFFVHAPLVVRELVRWQMARVDDRAGAGDPAEALRLAKQCLQVLDQIEAGGESSAYSIVIALERQQVLTRMLGLVQANEGLVSRDEHAAMVRDLRATVLRAKVWIEAGRRAEQPTPGPPSAIKVIELAILGSTPECFGLLLLAGCAAWPAAVWLGRGASQAGAMAAWQHAVAWILAWGIVYAAVGLAPAEIISRKAQSWLAAGAVGAVLLPLVFLWRRSRFRFTLRTAFIATFVCAVLCIPLAWLYREGLLADIPRWLSVPPGGAGNLDARSLESALKVAPNSWTAATLQWFLHGGLGRSALASLLVVLVWSAIRRFGAKGNAGQTPARIWWAALARDATRSALALAAILLLFDLALTPAALRAAEAKYQEVMEFFRHPEETYPAARAAIAAVEADVATMDALRRFADEDMKDFPKPAGP